MPEVKAQVELRVNVRSGQDPTALERAILLEARKAARELYVLVSCAEDEQAVIASGGIRQRREPRWVATLFGRIRIFRYRVKVGDETFHPLDKILGLPRSETSPALRRLVEELASGLSYRDIAKVVSELTGEPFSYQNVNRIVGESNGVTQMTSVGERSAKGPDLSLDSVNRGNRNSGMAPLLTGSGRERPKIIETTP